MEGTVIHWIGAVIGLILAIVLIFKKVNPVYALFGGAVVGGLLGGASLTETVQYVIDGTNSVMGAVVRVLAAGVLAGVLIESGAAERIAETIVAKLGEKKALLSIALATMIITAVGVFITVAIIIVAPIALSVGKKIGISKTALLLALVGGGKAGNIISPNPNTIAVAKGFNVDLSQVMINGFFPALAGLIVTVLVASLLMNKGTPIAEGDVPSEEGASSRKDKPSFGRAIVAPVIAIVLLAINPIGSILHIEALQSFKIDSMIILPLAGIIGLIAMKQTKNIIAFTTSGLNKMTGTAIILIGAGAIAGIISKSDLSSTVVDAISAMGISGTFLAPIAGILMGAATASTSTASIVAAGSFGEAILSMGTSPLNAAVMVHSGAVVIDHLPHGNFFHVTADAVKMDIKNRMKLIPYESIVGLTMTIVATILYGFIF
ncbi:gluconate:proton symporter [Paenibacillus sp. CAA11]|uniref:GntP family permease n=1 Tax=Paenibacillus sp. CAA11 TaxID=1532905 RepID=UPI000D36E7E1|nr:SLC13 family permease [Paenibacillus sp. CAA11]AWB46488.1 gluconate:proton symporter [Paenibacillus sp. CAA11]